MFAVETRQTDVLGVSEDDARLLAKELTRQPAADELDVQIALKIDHALEMGETLALSREEKAAVRRRINELAGAPVPEGLVRLSHAFGDDLLLPK